MSFGGGFGGFGTNNNQQSSAFGGGTGFGASSSGFGGGNNTFGANNNNNTTNSTGGLFGASANTGSTFGSPAGGFGANKPAFGTPATTNAGTGAGLFTSNAASGSGFGGAFGTFGQPAAATNNTTNTGFGSSGGSLFGAAKTGFGATGATGNTGSLFGQPSNTSTTGFGMAGGSSFGATNNPGIGTNIGECPGSTVAFTAFVEKEANNPSLSNAFQNLMFMEPYRKWSSEELRISDYNAGRRHGNPNGGAGAFGTGTGFGGFGTTQPTTSQSGFGGGTNSLFGGNTGGFGNTAGSTTTGFGQANTGGGLFGAKPATATGGGLFGGATASTTNTGMFGGGNNNTTSGFGAVNNNTTGAFGAGNTNTGGGLFGANKPAATGFGTQTTGGLFGNTATNTNTGFGAQGTATAGGGLFGNNNAQGNGGGGLFGNQQQPATTGFGATAFGNTGTNTGTGLFGNAQQKPAASTGLFGGTTTGANTTTGGGGLFGQNNNTQNAFGTNNSQQSGGLFGNKPATTSTGLFGGSTTGQTGTTGGGLFGSLGTNSQGQQPAQGGGLFGGLGQNQNKSLFGGSQPAGGGLFGTSQNNQQSTGLFGGSLGQQQQAPMLGMGNSMFGGSQVNQGTPQQLATGLADVSAYGAQSLFSNVPDNQMQNPGPLATPLTGKKDKARPMLSTYKLSPANQFVTPQKRGYGFSYSTYGTPNSVSSVASTPGGLSRSLVGGSFGRGLGKSISNSNLRRSFTAEERDSILLPGAFSANPTSRFLPGAGSHKKLVINRELRSGDLFASPAKDRKAATEPVNGARKLSKRVSFDTEPLASMENGAAAERTAGPSGVDGVEDQATPASPPPHDTRDGTDGKKASPSNKPAEMEQVKEPKGKELAIVHEEEMSPAVARKKGSSRDKKPGIYWMTPTKEAIGRMNRMQRQKVADFTVGRENVGSVRFNVPVDLSHMDLDHLFDEIVILEPRSATVYPIEAKKPPMGKGLNVPATIALENSWPRASASRKKATGPERTGRNVLKHVEHLKKLEGTKFLDYDVDTGVWTFSVEHFTTYGLEGDDEQSDEGAESDVESRTAPAVQLPGSPSALLQDATSPDVDPDDTFGYKRPRKAVPGAFDADEAALSDDEEEDMHDKALLLRPRASSLSSDEQGDDDMEQEDGEEEMQCEDEQPVTAAEEHAEEGPQAVAEADLALSRRTEAGQHLPAGIMRARMRAVRKSMAPTKIEVAGGNDWTQMLQESVRAPRTVDRATLRALNESGAAWDMRDRGSPAPKERKGAVDSAGFATSIDLMKSLFDQAKGPADEAASPARGFVKWPYQRRNKVDKADLVLRPRPRFGPAGVLTAGLPHGGILYQEVENSSMMDGSTLVELESYVERRMDGRVSGTTELDFTMDPSLGEKWRLAAILADGGDSHQALTTFWMQMVLDEKEAEQHLDPTGSAAAEKAILLLACNRVDEACRHLLADGDFRLANLVSCIGTHAREMRSQVQDWRDANALSEFSEPVRALYELLGGNACVCAGSKGTEMENRAESFVISERFGLDWRQAFGLRLFHTSGGSFEPAVRSFQADIEQGKEREPQGDALWALLKAFAYRRFDWDAVHSIGWLLTKVLMGRRAGAMDFGRGSEHWNGYCVSLAATLDAAGSWVLAAFVLDGLHDAAGREAAVLAHVARHAHALDPGAHDAARPGFAGRAFSVLARAGVAPAPALWAAKALDRRARQHAPAEFAALLRARDPAEAHRAFVARLAPRLVLGRDHARLLRCARALHRLRHALPDWDRAGIAFLLFPLRVAPPPRGPGAAPDAHDTVLVEALVHLWGGPAARGAGRDATVLRAALVDMAEELIRRRGHDARLFGILPGDVKERHFRDAVFAAA